MTTRPAFAAASTPTWWSDGVAARVGAGALALLAGLASGCQKKEAPPEQKSLPTSLGSASNDFLATALGNGLGLRAELASTSSAWERVVVYGEDSALLLGRDGGDVVALRTRDRGRTWTSMRAPAKAWAEWGVGADGSLVLMTGNRDKAVKPPPPPKYLPPRLAPIADGELWSADAGATALSGPRPFFPDDTTLKGAKIPSGYAQPARLEGDGVGLLLEMKGAQVIASALADAAPSGTPVDRSMREKLVPVAYGHPPQLVAIAGAAITVRPWPRHQDVLRPSSAVPGALATVNSWAQLAAGPQCEWGSWSFRRLAGPQPRLLGISGDRALAMPLPASESEWLGCGPDAVVTETAIVDPTDPQKRRRVPQLVRCGLDGKCSEPQSQPFTIWPEAHERTLKAVATSAGVVAVMSARAGERWGLTLGQSSDRGATFSAPRTIGEGTTDRGRIELGALVRFSKRVVMLLSADVTGTSRRGWYVLASDDDGTTWGPP